MNFLFWILAQVDDGGWSKAIVGAAGGAVFSFWYGWYITTKTLPDVEARHAVEREKANERCEAERREQEERHREERATLMREVQIGREQRHESSEKFNQVLNKFSENLDRIARRLDQDDKLLKDKDSAIRNKT